MDISFRQPLCLAAALALLAGCGNQQPVNSHAGTGATSAAAARPAARAPAQAASALQPYQRTNYDTVERYKTDVAQQVVSRNAGFTFEGQLPPMLPAIVVLRITVNGDGRLTDMFVQRSRDHQASAVALASMRRAGPLPKPLNLAGAPARTLSYSETFLFNADYKFQLRSLAGPQ